MPLYAETDRRHSAAALGERKSGSARSKKDDKKYIFRPAKKFWKKAVIGRYTFHRDTRICKSRGLTKTLYQRKWSEGRGKIKKSYLLRNPRARQYEYIRRNPRNHT